MAHSTMEGKRRARGSARHSEGRKVISEPWNEDEDRKLARLVERIGKKDWCMVASVMEGRTARQCRERYCNHVDEAITRGAFSCKSSPVRARPRTRIALCRAIALCRHGRRCPVLFVPSAAVGQFFFHGGGLCCAAAMGAADLALNRLAQARGRRKRMLSSLTRKHALGTSGSMSRRCFPDAQRIRSRTGGTRLCCLACGGRWCRGRCALSTWMRLCSGCPSQAPGARAARGAQTHQPPWTTLWW